MKNLILIDATLDNILNAGAPDVKPSDEHYRKAEAKRAEADRTGDPETYAAAAALFSSQGLMCAAGQCRDKAKAIRAYATLRSAPAYAAWDAAAKARLAQVLFEQRQKEAEIEREKHAKESAQVTTTAPVTARPGVK